MEEFLVVGNGIVIQSNYDQQKLYYRILDRDNDLIELIDTRSNFTWNPKESKSKIYFIEDLFQIQNSIIKIVDIHNYNTLWTPKSNFNIF